jgi:hypothetical protein
MSISGGGMPSRWEQVVVDARDPGQLARWWAEALGYVIVHEAPDEVEIRRSPDEMPGLLFGLNGDLKRVKNRLHIDLRPDDQTAEVDRLLDRSDPPTALVTAQNVITVGAVRALHRRGQQSEVALIGFDDLPLAELLTPGISVIAQDPAEIGRAAAERLFGRIEGDDTPAETIIVPARLVARGSGEIPAPGGAQSR